MTTRLPRKLAAGTLRAAFAATLLVGLAACSGSDDTAEKNTEADADDDGTASPEEVLAYAKTLLDETSGVELTLETADSPPEGDYLASASGTITDAPAFEGTISGRVEGLEGSGIDVVSVDGEVSIDAPVLGWTTIDPDTYCAPDPALLLDPDSGVSTVLTSAEGLEAGEAERGGEDNDEILTPYDGTVPSESIQTILPCAEGDDFDATFRVDGEGYLRSADITGTFFPGVDDDITYTITVTEYDVERDITAPE